MTKLIDCPMCGFEFDPSAHLACRSCPLNKGCQLVCCPQCGFENVDASRSTLARITENLFRRISDLRQVPSPTIED